MQQTATRRFVFDAGHRVLGHKGKCRHLHGHRYVAEVTVTASRLNELGMVIDFSVLKTRIGSWIDENWDHNLILNSQDPLELSADERTPYYLETDEGNPTAENLAAVLAGVSEELLDNYGLTVTHVRLWETENCYADWHR